MKSSRQIVDTHLPTLLVLVLILISHARARALRPPTSPNRSVHEPHRTVTAGSNYTWMMQNKKADGKYPDAHQELVLFVKDPVAGKCTKDMIEDNEARAKALLASTNYTEIEVAQVCKLTETVTQYSFHNNPISFLSLFTVEIPDHVSWRELRGRGVGR